VHGPSLAECCAGQALDPERMASIGVQVAEALAYAHGAGVVHRDVKPGNVLLGSDGRVRLSDFGIARLVGDTARHTRTGTTIGSPAYLSPEQVRGEEVTTAADVYSLGLVLLEALTGRRVYTGPATEAALARLSTPPEVPGDLPEGWRGLLAQMTALEADRRPTAGEVAGRLRGLHGVGPAVSGEPPSGPATRVLPRAPGDDLPRQPPEKAPPTRTTTVLRGQGPGPARHVLTAGRTRWALAALAVVLVVVLVVVTLVLLVRGSDPGSTGSEIPDGVPPRFEAPLRDLHEAVHGGAE
jgi:serine/threonine protein kinase